MDTNEFNVDVDSFLRVDTSLEEEEAPALLSPDLSDESDDSSKAKRIKLDQWYAGIASSGKQDHGNVYVDNMMMQKKPLIGPHFTAVTPLPTR